MTARADWHAFNDEYLSKVVGWIRLRLQRLANTDINEQQQLDSDIATVHDELIELEKQDPAPALIILSRILSLTDFERQVLALCAAMALDTRITGLCALTQQDTSLPYPSFGLAFALFDDPDWNTISPHAPLRYWRLIEISQPGATPLTRAALTIDERILNYLKGLNYLDDRIIPLLEPNTEYTPTNALPESQQKIVNNISRRLQQAVDLPRIPAIELLGHDSESKRMIAAKVALDLELNLHGTQLERIPSEAGNLENFCRLWQRECRLLHLALYLDCNVAKEPDKALLAQFLQRMNTVIFIDIERKSSKACPNCISIDVNKPTPLEQQMLWKGLLNGNSNDLPQRLSEQFSFNHNEITQIVSQLDDNSNTRQLSDESLWQSCRQKARAGMDQLANLFDAKADWNHLVLPKEQTSLLHQITDQVHYRHKVYEEWGFRHRMNRGLGISALFCGESGTGKTMAAEVIARDLKLDLYRIDLSSVVSKYIGETEKNLRKLFDAAEDSGAILFFDEADALFGKRSEIKDSHDRYANIEINYLLQRIESYRGLAILATNMKAALDKSFVRRLRFIVDFPLPDISERTRIWQMIFPPDVPLNSQLDFAYLARLNLSGGNIHSIALSAAFMAAKTGDSISMEHILNAARNEFKKTERPYKDTDFNWNGNLEAVI